MPHSMKRSGKRCGERHQAAVLDQIGVQHQQVRALLALRHQRPLVGGHQVVGLPRLAPRVADRRLGAARRRGPDRPWPRWPGPAAARARPGSWARSARPSGSRRARPSFSAGPSMKSTPRPFTVSATITFGRSVTASSDRNTRSMAATSWPSHRLTCQPKARNLASTSPRSLTLGHPGVGLDLVVVHHHHDLAQAAVGRRGQRLPELSLLQLAVAGQHEDAPRPAQAGGWPAPCPWPWKCPCPASRCWPGCTASRCADGPAGRRGAAAGTAGAAGSSPMPISTA